jgi:hypothetical protein
MGELKETQKQIETHMIPVFSWRIKSVGSIF